MDRAYLFRACSILFMYSFCGSIFCAYAALILFGLHPLLSGNYFTFITFAYLLFPYASVVLPLKEETRHICKYSYMFSLCIYFDLHYTNSELFAYRGLNIKISSDIAFVLKGNMHWGLLIQKSRSISICILVELCYRKYALNLHLSRTALSPSLP